MFHFSVMGHVNTLGANYERMVCLKRAMHNGLYITIVTILRNLLSNVRFVFKDIITVYNVLLS